jgi:hypothetical protein
MMMKRLMFVLGLVALLAVFSLAADQLPQSGGGMMRGMGGMHGMMGGGGGMMGGIMGCSFDFSQAISMEGTVESVAMAQGQGFPHFVLLLADGTRVTVVTAPFRTVLDANYAIAVANHMFVLAFQSTQNKEVFVAAKLTNGSNNNAVLTLRNASGAPVAAPGQGNGRGCAGRGNGTRGNCANR